MCFHIRDCSVKDQIAQALRRLAQKSRTAETARLKNEQIRLVLAIADHGRHTGFDLIENLHFADVESIHNRGRCVAAGNDDFSQTGLPDNRFRCLEQSCRYAFAGLFAGQTLDATGCARCVNQVCRLRGIDEHILATRQQRNRLADDAVDLTNRCLFQNQSSRIQLEGWCALLPQPVDLRQRLAGQAAGHDQNTGRIVDPARCCR